MSGTAAVTKPSVDATPPYKQRLVVYVVSHPKFEEAAGVAGRLYDHLVRDSQQPITRGIGIPVYFRFAAATDSSEAPAAIPLDEAHHTAVIVLVDDQMALHRKEGWADYVGQLHQAISPATHKHRLIFVKFSNHAFDVAPAAASSNFIRPPTGVAANAWPGVLLRSKEDAYSILNPITHELCRLLLGERQIDHAQTDTYGGRVDAPVTIFVSHAKRDGVAIAEGIRNHVAANTQLKTFFDSNDIPFGSEFAQILVDNLQREHTAMLVVQTDDYSTRDWCQWEVLLAKRYERPFLVLHGVKYGEKCSFPYLGNGPTLRFDPMGTPNYDVVLGQMLVEVLRNAHFRQHFQDLRAIFKGSVARALPQQPELYTLLELQKGPDGANLKTVVYPEPPLGVRLREVLSRHVPDVVVLTPVQLLAAGGQTDADRRSLTGTTVGMSIGDSGDLARLGFDKVHVDDAAVEFARYLLEAGATLAYGGDLRPGGFTELLRDVVWTYDESTGGGARLVGYLSWAIHQDKLVNDAGYLKWMDPKSPNRTTFHFIPRPADQASAVLSAVPSRESTDLLISARCLTAMRERMATDISARVLLGGKLARYSGRYPGLAEEAVLAVRAKQPLYLLGGFGGCTRAVIRALLKENPQELTEVFQCQDADYARMVRMYNQLRRVEPVDYSKLVGELEGLGLDGLSKANGLTREENERLFVTPHVVEMVSLVLRGLRRVLQSCSAGTAK